VAIHTRQVEDDAIHGDRLGATALMAFDAFLQRDLRVP
jgi:hypothetical protein